MARKRRPLSPGAALKLLAWFGRRGRKLPWRTQGRRDPYRVWLAEIMLQQTTVPAVIPYLRRFLKKWPDVHALSRARPESVLKAWAGLGYYARARNLHKTARIVATDFNGRFPDTAAELETLPGIGPYTAGAIAAIAFGRREAAIDGNVLRVMARVLGTSSSMARLKAEAEAALLKILPRERTGDFAEALMDLGATVCTPKAPACPACPWRGDCRAYALGKPEVFPVRAAKKPRPRKRATIFWIERAGSVLVRRRPSKGLLGGMLELPSTPWGDGKGRPPFGAEWKRRAGTVRHTFTHFELELEIQSAKVARAPRIAGGYWMKKSRLLAAGFPTVMKKVIRKALDE